MRLTNLQEQKVNEILNLYKRGVKKVEFKAPTGSGKTLMATHLIAKIMNENLGEKCIFIIATLSTSNLPQAFEEKINHYKDDLDFSDFEVKYYESPSNKANKSAKDAVVKIECSQNKVYIFGKASFGKDRIFSQQKIIDDFIKEAQAQGFKIVYIRDEAHYGTKASGKEIENFETLMRDNASFVLKMTATFDKNEANRVELRENELNNENLNDNKWLLKTRARDLSDETLNDEELIDKAILDFKHIKEKYKSLRSENINIRPAMLVQVDNKPKESEALKAWESTFALLKEKLSGAGFSWVVYFGDEKDYSNVDNANFTLSKISRNDDTTDCIIFKIGPATGWDIPRACMLLRLRNVCSSSLNIQTIGRIKRNPYPKLAKNHITNEYYLYENNITQREFIDFSYKVKKEFESIKIINVTISLDENIINKKKLEEAILGFVESRKSEVRRKIHDCFKANYFECDKNNKIYTPVLLIKMIEVLKDDLNANHKEVLKRIVKLLANEMGYKEFHPMQIELILLKFFLEELQGLYGKALKRENFTYKTSYEFLNPSEYVELRQKDDNKDKVEFESKKYLFEVRKNGEILTNDSDDNELFLDSKPENIVFKKLRNIARNNDELEIWCKNQKNSNIFIEYLDESGSKRKSYMDFIIKFKNGYYMYIEVKSQQDINIFKTGLLEESYQSYFQNRDKEYLKFDEYPIVLCLIKVDSAKIHEPSGIQVFAFYDTNDKKLQKLPFYDKSGKNPKNIPLESLCGYIQGIV